jgi:hypothetical protein
MLIVMILKKYLYSRKTKFFGKKEKKHFINQDGTISN